MNAPNPGQIIKFNTLLGVLKITDMKRQLIHDATGGRTEHTKDMDARELEDLNRNLAEKQKEMNHAPGHLKRRRILSICHQLPASLNLTKFDHNKGTMVVDIKRLDEFLCGTKSIYKKKFMDHTPAELSHVIVQFEHMLKGYLK